METVTISKDKLGKVIADVERLISDVEGLVVDQDKLASQRLGDIKQGKIKGKTEAELDDYLQKRGLTVD